MVTVIGGTVEKSVFNSGERHLGYVNRKNFGLVDKLIFRTKKLLNQDSAGKKLTYQEIVAARKLLDLYAFAEDWDAVSLLASRTILRGVGPKMTLCCYRYWIEALSESMEFESLQVLAKHLLSRRFQDAKYGTDYLALALVALTLAGRVNYARAVYRRLQQIRHKQKPKVVFSRYVYESFCIYLTHQIREQSRINGLRLFVRLAKHFQNEYLLLRGALSACADSDELETLAYLANLMHKCFRLAPEPYLLSAESLYFSSNNHGSCYSLKNFLQLYPNHDGAVLMFAQNLLAQGSLELASDWLKLHANMFVDGDFDYAYLRARVSYEVFVKDQNTENRDNALWWCGNAQRIAKKLGLPESSLAKMLARLQVKNDKEAVYKSHVVTSASPNVWIVSVSHKFFSNIRSKKISQIKCSTLIKKGDFVFFSKNNNPDKILGYLIAQTNALPDVRYGSMIFLEHFKMLKNPMSVFFGEAKKACQDSWGCENFSLGSESDHMSFSMIDLNYYDFKQDSPQDSEQSHIVKLQSIIDTLLSFNKTKGAS